MSGKLTDDIKKALGNAVLRGALDRFAENYLPSRERAYEGKDFEALRSQVAELKDRVVENLEALADQFEATATWRGAVVYRAKDAEDSNRYIEELAKSRGVRTAVKSKSFATEEIHLNSRLQQAGIEVLETDLGEWIIQLAGQKPSHMVMPAIHLTRQEVAQIFSKALGRPISDDIPEMVKVAREELRKAFLEADLGITGANMAIAETGTLVLLTNEGNARLATTLPPIHVAVVGYEKLIPSFRDALPILQTLPRSATAQQLTSYVTMITGSVPTRVSQGNAGSKGGPGGFLAGGGVGRKELHIILLDNGRRQMAQDPVFSQAMRCIRCASCLNVCPVYHLVGQVFGHIYIGGIGSILTAFLSTFELADAPQSLCINCGVCAQFCPAKIDIPGLIVELRQRLVARRGLPLGQKAIFQGILANRRLFHGLLRAASVAQKPIARGSPFIRHLPLFFSGAAEFRSLPAIAEVPFRDRVAANVRNPARTHLSAGTHPHEDRPRSGDVPVSRPRVAFYAGCLIDFAYPETGEAVFWILESEGFEVVFPDGQTCCGAPALFSGDRETAGKMARQNVEALWGAEAEHIITACPTCAHALRHDFPRLLKGEDAWQEKATDLSERIRDFSQFVYDLRSGRRSTWSVGGPSVAQSEPDALRQTRVTYHDSCHYKRKLGGGPEPRTLLAELPGLHLVEMKESDRCCGFGGSYSLKYPEISAEILKRTLENIESSGADVVAVDCPGCMLQLKGGLDKSGSRVAVKHTAEILAAGP